MGVLRPWSVLLPGVFAAIGFGGCGGGGTGPGGETCDSSTSRELSLTAGNASVFLLDTVAVSAMLTACGDPVEGQSITWTTWQMGWVGTGSIPILDGSLPSTVTDADGVSTTSFVAGTGGGHFVAASADVATDTIVVVVALPPTAYAGRGWVRLPDMPVASGFLSAVLYRDRIFVLGYPHTSFCSVDGINLEYDAGPATWTERNAPPDYSRDMCGRDPFDAGHAAASSAGIHLVFEDMHLLYDPETDRWSERSPPPFNPSGGTFTAVGDSLFLVSASGTMAMYVPATNSWSARASLLGSAGQRAAATTLDGRIYVAGGGPNWTGGSGFAVYDVAADHWTTLPAMPVARSAFAAAVSRGDVCVFGGGVPMYRNSYVLIETHCYEPDTGIWKPGPSLPLPSVWASAAESVGLIGISAVTRNDTVFALGGGAENTSSLSSGIIQFDAAVFVLAPR